MNVVSLRLIDRLHFMSPMNPVSQKTAKRGNSWAKFALNALNDKTAEISDQLRTSLLISLMFLAII